MQTMVSWSLPEPVPRDRTQLKRLLADAAGAQPVPWADVAVGGGDKSVALVARAPQAGAWLSEHAERIALGLSRALGDVAVIADEQQLQVSARREPGKRWEYSLALVLVAKQGKPWAVWRERKIEPAFRGRLEARLQADLGIGLGAFLPAFAAGAGQMRRLDVRLLDDGLPHVVSLQLPREGSPLARSASTRFGLSGSGVSYLGRRDLRVVMDHKISGRFYTGSLCGLGYGSVRCVGEHAG